MNYSQRLKTFKRWKSYFPYIRLVDAGFTYLQTKQEVCCSYCNVEINHWSIGDNPLIKHWEVSSNCAFVKKCIASQYRSIEARMETFTTWNKLPESRELAEAGFFYSKMRDTTICFKCCGGISDWYPSDDPWLEHIDRFPSCPFVIQRQARQQQQEIQAPQQQPTQAPPQQQDIEAPPQQQEIQAPQQQQQPIQAPQQQQEIQAPPQQQDIQAPQQQQEIQAPPQQQPIQSPQQQQVQIIQQQVQILQQQLQILQQQIQTPPTPPRRQDHSLLCKICFDRNMSIVFCPCRHIVCCDYCVSFIDKCPVCNKSIAKAGKIYIC